MAWSQSSFWGISQNFTWPDVRSKMSSPAAERHQGPEAQPSDEHLEGTAAGGFQRANGDVSQPDGAGKHQH